MDWIIDAFVVVAALVTLALKIWAFADAARFSKEQYRYSDRLPRLAWLLALGTAIVLQFWLGAFTPAEPFGPRSLTWLAGVLMAVVYFYDMRPRLIEAQQAGVP